MTDLLSAKPQGRTRINIDLTMPTNPTKRQRNAKACDECRRKKVKCDFLEGGPKKACFSCSLQGTPCVFSPSTKSTKRKPKVAQKETPGNKKQVTSQNTLKVENTEANGFQTNKNDLRNFTADFSSGFDDAPDIKTKHSKNQSSKENHFGEKLNIDSPADSKPASLYRNLDENLHHDKEGSRMAKSNISAGVAPQLSTSKPNLKRPDTHIQDLKENNNNNNKQTKKPRTEKSKHAMESEKSKKYESLFKMLLPGLPNLEKLNMDLFLKIVENMKNSSNEFKNDMSYSENSVDYLKLAVEQYNYVTHNRVPIEKVSSFNFCLQTPLPPKEVALGFIEKTSQECCVLFRFYHRPTFSKNLDDLYRLSPAEYTSELKTFLPLCYSVMAVGALFSKSSNNTSQDPSKKPQNRRSSRNAPMTMNDKDLADEGYKYFLAARRLIDLTNARDLYSIQTIVMLFIFLQCSARISTCYLFIGVAMRSALREGLHRNIPLGTPGFSLLDIEMRKRTFFSIYKMDVYVNTMLGLPRTISQQDFDQTLPLEVEDDCLTHDGIVSPPQSEFSNNDSRNNDSEEPFEKNTLSSACIANQHTKIIMILDEIVEGLYPIKKANNLISHDFVTKLESKLNDWLTQLPEELNPSISDFSKFSASSSKRHFLYKANRLLRLSFLQVQIVLYRPFIHYLTFKNSKNRYHLKPDELSIKRADNCLGVAQTVITLAKEMMDNHLLSGNYWFSVYTIFFSVAGLIFYIHEFVPTTEVEIAKYKRCVQLSKIGKDILDVLKNSSMAASRTYNILNILFESLNKKTKTFMLQQQLLEEQQLKKQTQQQGQYSPQGNQGPEVSNTMLASPLFLTKQDSNLQHTGQPGAASTDNAQKNTNTIASSLLGTTPDSQTMENTSNKNPLASKITIEQSLEELYNMDFSNFEQFMNDTSLKDNNTMNNVFANMSPIANTLQNANIATDGKIFADNVNSYLSKSGNSSNSSTSSGNPQNNSLNFPTSSDLHPYLPRSPLQFSSVGNQSIQNLPFNENAVTASSMSNSSSMLKNSTSFPLFPKTNITRVSKQNIHSSINEDSMNSGEPIDSFPNATYGSSSGNPVQPQVPSKNISKPSFSGADSVTETNSNKLNDSGKENKNNASDSLGFQFDIKSTTRNKNATSQNTTAYNHPDSNDETSKNNSAFSNNNESNPIGTGNMTQQASDSNKKDNINEHINVTDGTNNAEDPLYLTGVFDQLDMQLFGRFLPPYMSRTNETDSVQSTTLNDLTSENKP